MNKILMVGMSGNLGGIEIFIINFWRNINKKYYQIDFIKFDDTICFEHELVLGGSLIYKLPDRKTNVIKYNKSIIDFYKTHKEYKIIHVHLNTASSIEAAFWAKVLNRVVIAHSHSAWQGSRWITRLLHFVNRPILCWCSSKKISCSNDAGKWMFNNCNFIIIKNAINIMDFVFNNNKRIEIRNKLHLNGKFVIGTVGRLNYAKNHIFLLDIFARVVVLNKQAFLIIVGDGELKNTIHEKINNLGLEKYVKITGSRMDIPDLLQSMDVFVFPSLFEGLGISLIEAQANGLPCVVSDKVPEEAIIIPNVVVLDLNESKDVWVNELLLTSKSKRLSNASIEISNAGYDIMKECKKLENIYKEVANDYAK